MKIKSLNDIPEALFYPLKEWSEQSIGNFNLLVGIGFIFVMLVAVIACDMFFPRGYLVNQFFMFKYGIACFVSGLYLFLQYRKDFK